MDTGRDTGRVTCSNVLGSGKPQSAAMTGQRAKASCLSHVIPTTPGASKKEFLRQELNRKHLDVTVGGSHVPKRLWQ